MEELVPAKANILRLWGVQSPARGVYRLISHAVKCGDLLHNTVTGELVRLDGKEQRLLDALPAEYEPWMDGLIGKHFIVPLERDDYKQLEALRLAAGKLYSRQGISAFTVLPTTGCNARCPYCYEKGISPVSMDSGTALAAAEFMRRLAVGQTLGIAWFGGEPLLGENAISLICRSLSQSGTAFESSMVTNGLLFNEKSIKTARDEWRLKRVQISLDGSAAYYNRTKNCSAAHSDPFERVLGNIKALLGAGIRVSLRLNLGGDNYGSLEELIGILKKHFAGDNGLAVNVAVLYGLTGLENKKAALEELIQSSGLRENGRDGGLMSLVTNRCMADSGNALLIDPEGGLSLCEHDIFSRCAGDIYTGYDIKAAESFAERQLQPECGQCPLLPGCIRLKHCAAAPECTEALRSYKYRRLENAIIRAAQGTAEIKEDAAEGC